MEPQDQHVACQQRRTSVPQGPFSRVRLQATVSTGDPYHEVLGIGTFRWLSAKSLIMRLRVLPPFPCM